MSIVPIFDGECNSKTLQFIFNTSPLFRNVFWGEDRAWYCFLLLKFRIVNKSVYIFFANFLYGWRAKKKTISTRAPNFRTRLCGYNSAARPQAISYFFIIFFSIRSFYIKYSRLFRGGQSVRKLKFNLLKTYEQSHILLSNTFQYSMLLLRWPACARALKSLDERAFSRCTICDFRFYTE